MLSITHMATGAIIASVLPNPMVYVPLVIASHFLEDWIPHWDIGTGLQTGKKTKVNAIFQEIFEIVLGFGFIYLAFANPNFLSISWHVWIGAVLGLLPDFLAAPKNFLDIKIPGIESINNFHDRFHSMTTDPIVGLLPQILILWIVYLLG